MSAAAKPTVTTTTGQPDEPDTFEILLDLQRAQGVAWMLIRCFGGEIPKGERASDEDLVCCVQYLNRTFHRIRQAGDGIDNGDYQTAICDGRGIASTLDAMTWSDGMKLMGSDHVMSALIDAMDDCLARAEKALDSPHPVVAQEPQAQLKKNTAPAKVDRVKAGTLATA